MRVQDILSLDKEITSDPRFAKISERKNYFLVPCKGISLQIDLYGVNVKSCFGGLIGKDDSRLERTFSFSKNMRMHSVLHDASGFMKRYSNEGPGYIYVLLTHSPELFNECFLGNIQGVLYCCFPKVVERKLFKSSEVWSFEDRKKVQVFSTRTKISFSRTFLQSIQKQSSRTSQNPAKEMVLTVLSENVRLGAYVDGSVLNERVYL